MRYFYLYNLTIGVFIADCKNLAKDFWCIDCLIRILKEILFTKTLKLHEGDVMTISELLFEKSEKLTEKIFEFKKNVR